MNKYAAAGKIKQNAPTVLTPKKRAVVGHVLEGPPQPKLGDHGRREPRQR